MIRIFVIILFFREYVQRNTHVADTIQLSDNTQFSSLYSKAKMQTEKRPAEQLFAKTPVHLRHGKEQIHGTHSRNR